jgi:hypothetical protein
VKCSKPVNNTANIQFMKSFSGGMQLHVREGEVFEYVFEAPTAGRYLLTAQVVSIHKDQQLSLTSDGLKTPLEIPIPYTLGKWEDTKPLGIELIKGRNVLRFSRKAPNSGVTVKQFTLRPAN